MCVPCAWQVTFGEDARKKLADGINAVADAVKVCACKMSEPWALASTVVYPTVCLNLH